MFNEPLISVVIPFYNEEKYIYASILSIVNQTYKNLEIILIDDNSTDNSLNICKTINDPRIKIYIKKNNEIQGRATSRNVGCKLATGKYITFHDADDISHPERLKIQYEAIKDNENYIVGCGVNLIDGNIKTHYRLPEKHGEIIKGFHRIFNRVTLVAGTMMCDSTILKEFKYREKFKYQGDWDLLLRIYESNRFKFYNVSEKLYDYILRSNGTKNQSDWVDYNLFVRNCQERRRKNLYEFENIDDFFDEIKNNRLKNFKYILLKILLNIKNKLSSK